MALGLFASGLGIDGYGEMENYEGRYGTPWTSFYKDIVKVILPAGITNISNYAFCGCSNITEINIPDSFDHIGDYAFRGCSSLTSFKILGKVTTIGRTPFYKTPWLEAKRKSDGYYQ